MELPPHNEGCDLTRTDRTCQGCFWAEDLHVEDAAFRAFLGLFRYVPRGPQEGIGRG